MRLSAPPIEARLAAAERRPGPWLALLACLLAAQVSARWSPTPDSVVYLSIARSVASGGGLRSLGSDHLGYPPGYPLLIAPAFLAGERPFLLLSAVNAALAIVLLLGVFRWMRRIVPGRALLLTAFVMVNVSLWIHLRRTLGEIAFMAALVWSALALERALDAPTPRSAFRSIAAALPLLVATLLIRESGALLVFGLVIAVMIRPSLPAGRRNVLVATAFAGGVAALAALLVVLHDRSTAVVDTGPVGSHLDGFLDATIPFADRVLEGARLRVNEIGRLLVPGMFKAYGEEWLDWNMVVYVPVLLIVATGWWKLFRATGDVLLATLPAYVALYVVWGFDAGTRYLLPMLPVLAASAGCGRFLERRPALGFLLVAAHLAVAAGYVLARDAPRARACDAEWPAVERLAAAAASAPAPVLAPGVPECTRLLLSFTLDRPVSERFVWGFRWVLEPDDAPASEERRVAARAGGYRLSEVERAEP